MDDAITRISAELSFALRDRASSNHSRMLQGSSDARHSRSWGEDYGSGKQIPIMDAQRLRSVSSGSSSDSSSSIRTGSVVDGFVSRKWSEVSSFCRGTKVLIGCCGVAAFIAVMRGADMFY